MYQRIKSGQIYTSNRTVDCFAETELIEDEICSVVSWVFYHGRMTRKQKGFLKSLLERRQAGLQSYKELKDGASRYRVLA